MLEPELCPAGFICSEFGLSQPVVQCPPGFYCPAGTLTDDLSSSIPADPNAPPYIGDFVPGRDAQPTGFFRRLLGTAEGEGDDGDAALLEAFPPDFEDPDDERSSAALGRARELLSPEKEELAEAEEQHIVTSAIARYSRRHRELRRLWRHTPAGAQFRRSEALRLKRRMAAAERRASAGAGSGAGAGAGSSAGSDDADTEASADDADSSAVPPTQDQYAFLLRQMRGMPSAQRLLRRLAEEAGPAAASAAAAAAGAAGGGGGGGGVGGRGRAARRLDPRYAAPQDLESDAPLARAFQWGGTGNFSAAELYSPSDESMIYREFFLNASDTDPGGFKGVPMSMFMQAARALVLNLLVSGPRAPTYSYMQSAPLKPVACLPGTFCLGGVSSSVVSQSVPINPLGITSPQNCTEGAYCRYATPSSAGTGTCFPGHYCPPGSVYPLKTPLGNFATGGANVAPTMCFPGTYAPLVAYSVCRTCPAGYSCQSYGTYEPAICPPGTYRSLADSISCVLCDFGTYSSRPGNIDITDCRPCPMGRVCALQSMSNLTQSVACPDGHACGQATTSGRQFDHECPAGFYCDVQTTPERMMSLQCPPGVYCLRGTKLTLVTRNQCSVGYFCPLGTAAANGPEVACPMGTTSLAGRTSLLDCQISPMTICNKVVTSHYYDTLTYTFQGVSQTIGSPTTTIEVLAIVDPVNVTASDDFWFNDTFALSRMVPAAAAPLDPGFVFQIIGRGFDPTMLLFCKWNITALRPDPTTGNFSANTSVPWGSLVSRGEVVSTYRLNCPTPKGFAVPGDDKAGTTYPAEVWVTYLGGHFDYSQSVKTVFVKGLRQTAAFIAARQKELLAQFYNGVQEEAPLPLANQNCECRIARPARDYPKPPAQHLINSLAAAAAAATPLSTPLPPPLNTDWFELPGLHYARISMDLRHISPEMVYDQHWRIAIYVDNSTCIDSACDVDRNVITNPAVTFTNYLGESVTLVNFPCPKPIPMPFWFEDTSVKKNDILNFTLTSIEDLRFHIEVQILYGLFLSTAEQFRNTTSVRLAAPSRALNFAGNRTNVVRPLAPVLTNQGRYIQEAYAMQAIYTQDLTLSISAQLNMPSRYSATERGRIVPGFNVSELRSDVPWISDPFTEVFTTPVYWSAPSGDIVQLTQLYRETYQEIQGMDTTNPIYTFTRFLQPWLPYLSNCYGFDSNMWTAQLLEDDVQCSIVPDELDANPDRAKFPALPAIDDIYPVTPAQLMQSPVADSCHRSIMCLYEDQISVPLVLPRWYEVGDSTELFSVLRNAISFEGFVDFGTTIDRLTAAVSAGDPLAEGIDVMIHGMVDRSAAQLLAGACTVLCIPRSVLLTIHYYQQTKAKRQLIQITLAYDSFDRNYTDASFQLDVDYMPLNWIDLFFKFAFTQSTYLTTFMGIGTALVCGYGFFWIVNRLLAEVKNGGNPPFNWLGFFSLTIPPILTGSIIGTIPWAMIVGFIYYLFNGWSLVYGPAYTDNTWCTFLRVARALPRRPLALCIPRLTVTTLALPYPRTILRLASLLNTARPQTSTRSSASGRCSPWTRRRSPWCAWGASAPPSSSWASHGCTARRPSCCRARSRAASARSTRTATAASSRATSGCPRTGSACTLS